MDEPEITFLKFICASIAKKPDAILVSRSVDEMGVLLTLSVDQEDMGLIIGREGGTAKAIRTLVRIAGMKNGSRINVKIVDSLPRPTRPTIGKI